MAEIWQTISFNGSSIDIWRINLKAGAKTLATAQASLSRAELARAAHLLMEDDRRRFIMSRAALRSSLSHYLALAPEAIRFSIDAQGQPSLPAHLGWNFSMARRRDQAVIAVAQGMQLAIEFETVDLHSEAMFDFANYCCHAGAELPATISSSSRTECYRRGVREAVMRKALGRSAAFVPSLAGVAAEARSPRLLSSDPANGKLDDWALLDLEFGDAVAALMVAHTSQPTVADEDPCTETLAQQLMRVGYPW